MDAYCKVCTWWIGKFGCEPGTCRAPGSMVAPAPAEALVPTSGWRSYREFGLRRALGISTNVRLVVTLPVGRDWKGGDEVDLGGVPVVAEFPAAPPVGDLPAQCFVCPDCGPGVAADEDGCCATCGADCSVGDLPAAPRRFEALVDALADLPSGALATSGLSVGDLPQGARDNPGCACRCQVMVGDWECRGRCILPGSHGDAGDESTCRCKKHTTPSAQELPQGAREAANPQRKDNDGQQGQYLHTGPGRRVDGSGGHGPGGEADTQKPDATKPVGGSATRGHEPSATAGVLLEQPTEASEVRRGEQNVATPAAAQGALATPGEPAGRQARRITREAYQQLIDENLAWLRAQPRTLEREHIIMIVERSVDDQYPPAATPAAQRRPAREVPTGDRVLPIKLDPFVRALADRWWDYGEGDDHWGVLTGALSEMLAIEADRRGEP